MAGAHGPAAARTRSTTGSLPVAGGPARRQVHAPPSDDPPGHAPRLSPSPGPREPGAHRNPDGPAREAARSLIIGWIRGWVEPRPAPTAGTGAARPRIRRRWPDAPQSADQHSRRIAGGEHAKDVSDAVGGRQRGRQGGPRGGGRDRRPGAHDGRRVAAERRCRGRSRAACRLPRDSPGLRSGRGGACLGDRRGVRDRRGGGCRRPHPGAGGEGVAGRRPARGRAVLHEPGRARRCPSGRYRRRPARPPADGGGGPRLPAGPARTHHLPHDPGLPGCGDARAGLAAVAARRLRGHRRLGLPRGPRVLGLRHPVRERPRTSGPPGGRRPRWAGRPVRDVPRADARRDDARHPRVAAPADRPRRRRRPRLPGRRRPHRSGGAAHVPARLRPDPRAAPGRRRHPDRAARAHARCVRRRRRRDHPLPHAGERWLEPHGPRAGPGPVRARAGRPRRRRGAARIAAGRSPQRRDRRPAGPVAASSRDAGRRDGPPGRWVR
jgi:hypothetical protein